jgi:RNA-directed DNA polymerase
MKDDADPGKQWARYNFKSAEKTLSGLQRDIASAALKKDFAKVKIAQNHLIGSLDARVLAVKHVCDRVHVPGINNVIWRTDAERMDAARSLDYSRTRQAEPTRLCIINPTGKKERIIEIPTTFDRAMQVLYSFALDPVSEVTADRKSFAARRGRSMNDLHVYLMRALDNRQENGPPAFVIKTDVKMCYASISHDWLRKNIPMNTFVLDQFLNAGHVFCGEFFPSDDDNGIPIGGSISPILANMALDGAQRAVHIGLHGSDVGIDYTDGYLLRFADDMIITVRAFDSIDKIMQILEEFLKPRGMRLSLDKTQFIDLSNEGFDFLSRRYRCRESWVDATPSDTAIAKMESSLRDVIRSYRGGQKTLIDTLNQMLFGWANYHKITDATTAFRHIDNVVSALLLELCEKLYPNTPRQKLINKYFYQPGQGLRVYALVDKPSVRVIQLQESVTLIRHTPVPLAKNPYIDDCFFEERTKNREIANITGKYKNVWIRQNEKCYYCGKPILIDERKCIVPINPELPQSAKNAAYVHTTCSYGQVEFFDSEYDFIRRFNFHELLERMLAGRAEMPVHKDKYYALGLFFQKQDRDRVTLQFNEIEEIIGQKLCNSAFTDRRYWSQPQIKSCWQLNGYRVQSLEIEAACIVFKRFEEVNGEMIDLPEWLYGRLPQKACAEVKDFLAHIQKKYGL